MNFNHNLNKSELFKNINILFTYCIYNNIYDITHKNKLILTNSSK